MTEQEAATLRKNVAKLREAVRVAYLGALYRVYNVRPGDKPEMDDYFNAMFEQNDELQGAFYDLGVVGVRCLLDAGWNPFVEPPDEGGKPLFKRRHR